MEISECISNGVCRSVLNHMWQRYPTIDGYFILSPSVSRVINHPSTLYTMYLIYELVYPSPHSQHLLLLRVEIELVSQYSRGYQDIIDSNVCGNHEFNFITDSDQEFVVSRVWLGTGSLRSTLSSPASQVIKQSPHSRPFQVPAKYSMWLFGPSSPHSCLFFPCNAMETCGG